MPWYLTRLPRGRGTSAQRMLIEAYRERWSEMIGGAIDATVQIARELRERGVPLYGLTNWSAETYPHAQQRFEFLDWFAGIVVSGVEQVIKPSPETFRILLERFDLRAEDGLFIDDNPINIEAAKRLGLDSHHFRTAADLRRYLTDHRLL